MKNMINATIDFEALGQLFLYLNNRINTLQRQKKEHLLSIQEIQELGYLTGQADVLAKISQELIAPTNDHDFIKKVKDNSDMDKENFDKNYKNLLSTSKSPVEPEGTVYQNTNTFYASQKSGIKDFVRDRLETNDRLAEKLKSSDPDQSDDFSWDIGQKNTNCLGKTLDEIRAELRQQQNEKEI